jgi:hypothetical protein
MLSAKQTVVQKADGELPIDFHCHCAVNFKNLACVIITDGEYPFRVGMWSMDLVPMCAAYDLLNKIQEEVLKQYGEQIYG